MSFGEYELLSDSGPGLQFPFPFFDVLVIPTDAGPGEPRIEIGPNAIFIYDNNGDLFASITPDDGLQVFDPNDPGEVIQVDIVGGLPTLMFKTGDADEDSPANLTGVVSGVGAARNLTLSITSGNFAGGDRGRIDLRSESFDGTEQSRVLLDADSLAMAPGMRDVATGPVGTIIGKVQVFSGITGTSLGFIPLYDAIT